MENCENEFPIAKFFHTLAVADPDGGKRIEPDVNENYRHSNHLGSFVEETGK